MLLYLYVSRKKWVQIRDLGSEQDRLVCYIKKNFSHMLWYFEFHLWQSTDMILVGGFYNLHQHLNCFKMFDSFNYVIV